MLAATFLRLRAEGFSPMRDLVIAFTGDEETGMETVRDLVTTHRDLIDAEYALNADIGGGILNESDEAIYYYLQAAEKTFATFELTVRNAGGHSALLRLDNAIYELAGCSKKNRGVSFPCAI